ncbi:lipopolysaccharide biosynthesis protein [Nitrosomonas sp. Nm166]|uniref:lipopolysaccharide biosynthesis protein n=1 Tax=Nitrosomonas sp. Nm166 TaxID=1881054 RepID=UPI0008E83AF7|nr:oligosaccharide flippase family protein [Nitrosomonas sp. Nm166]SFD91488.1 Membrane protein involved in the export of O-antigen and teichoic acid [Nitrosomonas sp. Nm166]
MSSALKSQFDSLKRNGGAFALSGSSQIISSLTNFGIVLYLVRILEKDDFGLYSLGFASYLIISALLAAIFAVQYVVNNPDRAEHERRSYAMHHVVAMIIISILIVLLAAMLKVALSIDSELIYIVQDLALPVAMATLGFATRDMVVRIAFVERREWLVLGSAMSVATSTAIAFFIIHILSINQSASMGLGIVAFSQLIGAVFTLYMLRLPWCQLSFGELRKAFVESWQGGRWYAMTSIVYSVRTQAHNFVILPILGLAALAEVNATRILLTPAVMAIPPLYQVVMPRLAEMRGRNPVVVQRHIWITVAGLVGFALIYSAALLSVLDIALPLALGPSYAALEPVVLAWCAVTVFMAARNGLTMGLEIRKEFKDMLIVNSSAALVAIILAAGFSFFWGGMGAVWAFAMAELILCLLLYRVLMRALTKEKLADEGKTESHGAVASVGKSQNQDSLQRGDMVPPMVPKR